MTYNESTPVVFLELHMGVRDELLLFNATAYNSGPRNYTLDYPCASPWRDSSILDEQGDIVHYLVGPVTCHEAGCKVLGPGSSETLGGTWDGSNQTANLPAGSYNVTVHFSLGPASDGPCGAGAGLLVATLPVERGDS